MSFQRTLSQVLREQNLDAMGIELGIDAEATETAVSAAMPFLLTALAKNASTAGGAAALHQTLEDHHDGTLLAQLVHGSGNYRSLAARGGGILEHVFGTRKDDTTQALCASTGLSIEATDKLLCMLAPVVMGALGHQQRREGLGTQGLAALLSKEQRSITQDDATLSRLFGRR